MTIMQRSPLLHLSDVSVNFGLIEALKHVDLDIHSQEILALVGDNGAGKSTLVKIIAGLYQPTSGTLTWKGNDVAISSIRVANTLGITTVFQDMEFCDNLSVASNIFLGQEITDRYHKLDDYAMSTIARKVLSSLSSAISVNQPIASLSAGQRQTVAIASTLLNNPDLILMDEPTASLSVLQTAETLSHIKSLRNSGKSIVLVCHNLPDVFAVADRIAIMRHGRIVGIHNTADVSYEQVIAQIAGVRNSDISEFVVEKMSEQRHLIDRYAQQQQ